MRSRKVEESVAVSYRLSGGCESEESFIPCHEGTWGSEVFRNPVPNSYGAMPPALFVCLYYDTILPVSKCFLGNAPSLNPFQHI